MKAKRLRTITVAEARARIVASAEYCKVVSNLGYAEDERELAEVLACFDALVAAQREMAEEGCPECGAKHLIVALLERDPQKA